MSSKKNVKLNNRTGCIVALFAFIKCPKISQNFWDTFYRRAKAALSSGDAKGVVFVLISSESVDCLKNFFAILF